MLEGHKGYGHKGQAQMDRGLGIDWQVNPSRQAKVASYGNGVDSEDAGQLVFI